MEKCIYLQGALSTKFLVVDFLANFGIKVTVSKIFLMQNGVNSEF